jgi:hypothetical protein
MANRLFPGVLLAKRNGEVYTSNGSDAVLMGIVQKTGNRWAATSAITHIEETNFRIREDALWWLIAQYEGDNW